MRLRSADAVTLNPSRDPALSRLGSMPSRGRVILKQVLAVALALVAVAACGGGASYEPPGAAQTFPSAVSSRPNRWCYFAPETTVVAEDGRVLVLRGSDQAAFFNASIACQGRIIGLSRQADRVWAAFILDQRGTFACPAPGVIDTARFTVQGGRIIRFEDLPD